MIDLPTYILISIAYLLTMNLAVYSSKAFNGYINVTIFAIGAMMGWAVDSYITGLAFAITMHWINY